MTVDMTPRGPFETADEVIAAAQPLRDAVRAIDPADTLIEQLRARWIDIRAHFITSTLTGCGVVLGAQDERTVRWMAATMDQPETIVLLDFVKRAYAAGMAELPVLDDEAPEPVHALPPIDFPGRIAGVEPGPRCGARGRTALFASDVTCADCIALMHEAGDA